MREKPTVKIAYGSPSKPILIVNWFSFIHPRPKLKRWGCGEPAQPMSNRTDRWVEDFIIKPVIMLVGIYVVAVVIATFAGIDSNLFPPIFTAAGGIPAIGLYFKKKLNED